MLCRKISFETRNFRRCSGRKVKTSTCETSKIDIEKQTKRFLLPVKIKRLKNKIAQNRKRTTDSESTHRITSKNVVFARFWRKPFPPNQFEGKFWQKIKSLKIENGRRIRNLLIEIAGKMLFPFVFDSRKFSLHFPKPVPFFQLFSILRESASCDVSRQSKFYADSESANENVVTWVERREKKIFGMLKKIFFSKIFLIVFSIGYRKKYM